MFKEKAAEAITKQQEGHKGKTVFYVGEQLKGICVESEKIAEIIFTDLLNPDMSIEAAEKQIKAYADKNRKGASSFCVTPDIADGILRKFYGVDGISNEVTKTEPPVQSDDYIDLSDFI